MGLSFRIAWRFLSSSKGQTILITLGIAIGISVQVFIGSLISGLQASLIDKTVGSSPHITILPAEYNGKIEDYSSLIETMDKQFNAVTHISAAADASGFIQKDEDTFPVLVRGFDMQAADGIYKISDSLVDGRLPAGDEIAIGKELMELSGLKTGDKTEIRTPFGELKQVTVSGVFDLKVAGINKTWAIAELPFVQKTFGYDNQVTSIELQVDDVFAADSVAADIASILPAGLKADNWKAQNESLLSGLSGQSISSLMIQVFVLVSVVLGIASVLAVSVIQKSRQIGILKAMGIKNRSASFIFLFQGLILGFFGSAAGVLLGLGLSYAFTTFAVNPDGTPVVALLIDVPFIAMSGVIGILSAAAASLIPASRSSRLDPIEVIRNG